MKRKEQIQEIVDLINTLPFWQIRAIIVLGRVLDNAFSGDLLAYNSRQSMLVFLESQRNKRK